MWLKQHWLSLPLQDIHLLHHFQHRSVPRKMMFPAIAIERCDVAQSRTWEMASSKAGPFWPWLSCQILPTALNSSTAQQLSAPGRPTPQAVPGRLGRPQRGTSGTNGTSGDRLRGYRKMQQLAEFDSSPFFRSFLRRVSCPRQESKQPKKRNVSHMYTCHNRAENCDFDVIWHQNSKKSLLVLCDYGMVGATSSFPETDF